MQTQSLINQAAFKATSNQTVRSSLVVNASMLNSSGPSQLSFAIQKSNIRKTRWVSHVSSATTLTASHKLVLNIKPTKRLSAFDIIERLLFSKTCGLIYSDESLPLHQVQMLKQMAMFSGTDLIFIADKAEFNLMQSGDLEKA